jgi:hypothetical protein
MTMVRPLARFGPSPLVRTLAVLPALALALHLAAPVRAARTIDILASLPGNPPSLTNQILTANFIGYFTVQGDVDFYDGLPHQEYWICLQESTAFDAAQQCDMVSVTDGYGPTRAIVPFEEALNPLRGQRVNIWMLAWNFQTNEWDNSYTYEMRVAPSNITLRPHGHEDEAPYDAVYPNLATVFDSLEDFSFRWPKTTTGFGGIWGGNNTGAIKHILTIQLQQSSATCERTKFACPGTGNVCASTDPLACAAPDRGYCTYTEPCSRHSDQVSFEIDLDGLTGSLQDVGKGRARETVFGGHTYIELFPDAEEYEHLLSQVNADRLHWRVATCMQVAGVETCGRTESASQIGLGTIGIPGGGGDPGGGGLPSPGTAFGSSPLVDTFEHPACLTCHVLERDATATPPVGFGALHANFVGGAENLTNPASCSGCHPSTLAPQILGTSYSAEHGLDAAFGGDYAAWWSWFAPEYEGALTWPEHLEDPASEDYDPATACALFKQANPTAESMKHHLFEDPRVLWSIVGGNKPSLNFVDELAPPGSALDESSPLADKLTVLDQWEDWVNDWVDGGMNCGSTYGGFSTGGGPNEEVNTTPPITSSDGSSGTWVGSPPGSDATTITHLDCTPDVDSDSDRCAWTFFACGSDADAVDTLIQGCTEETAESYRSPEVPSPAGLCDQPVSPSCYKIDPGDGSSGYYSVVQIPAEIGDRTMLAFFSIDVEDNQEFPKSEMYDFVEADLIAPRSSAELFWDVDAGEHQVRFSCHDNSDTCMIFYKVNDPGEDETPQFNMSNQILNSNGNPFDSDGNVLGFLQTDRIQRIRWAAIDGAAGQKNVELDRLCKPQALELCPGKLAEQNACVATCEDGIRASCELGCGASSGGTTAGDVEEDCVAACIAESPTDCSSGCAETCAPTNTGCPGTGGSTGVPLDTSCNSRTNPIQCYHELVYDPTLAGDTAAPQATWNDELAPRSDGTYERAFPVTLQCSDPLNECEIYYTLDGSEPTADPRLRYSEALIIPGPASGRTATTTLEFFTQDDAVPPNQSPVETLVFTVALPHTDDDSDGFTEDDGDCNDGNNQIFPGATEICDFIDNDCDGVVDEGLMCPSPEIFSDGFESGSTSAWSGG